MRLDAVLDQQRQQFALWMTVAFGLGIACWFVLPSPGLWLASLCLFVTIGAAGWAIGGYGGRLLICFGLLAAAGLALIWMRAELVRAPRLDRPVTTLVSGKVERVERLAGRGLIRVTLADEAAHSGIRMRVSFREHQASEVQSGMRIAFRARLMPPSQAAIPGGYDFARFAWFKGIGATGRGLEKPRMIEAPSRAGFWPFLDRQRGRLTAHVQNKLGGAEGGIAASFVTGDQGGVPEDIAQALRDSGLTHLLSISGLHVAAVVGFVMFATRKVLALSVRAATYWPLTLIGAAMGVMAGIAYSLLAGGEVPTVRSCIAALLVLLGLTLGREAITLRLVATGAFLILLFRPEALVGASFQLSFAAVVSLVALNELPWLRNHLMKRDELWWAGFLRMIAGLLLTGLVIEAALAPIGLYHFNRMGAYGALANIIAIPLTTFIIMPLEAMALLLDPLGISGPFWLLVKWALSGLVMLATWVAAIPGGVTLVPEMPTGAFALMVLGGLWLALWCGRLRLWGLMPFVAGAIWAWSTPTADIYVTGDGRHLGVRSTDGRVYLLRSRAGDYVRGVMTDSFAAVEAAPLDESDMAQCSTDSCIVDIWRDGKRLRLLATRSNVFIDRSHFERACADADIVISDRKLPYWCASRWLKADRPFLQKTGGLAIYAGSSRIVTVAQDNGQHPWSVH